MRIGFGGGGNTGVPNSQFDDVVATREGSP